jgi:FKBP-type peptidyl-prolyl cis-trans isomerase (trigger factor)
VIQSPTADKNGRGMILGIWVDDFSKQVGSPKPGDTVTIKAKGPEGHEIEGIRNANLTVTFKIDRIDRILPASLDKVLASAGMQFEDQLKEAIRTKLRQNIVVQQQTAMRQQLSKHLLENTKMDLPERLTAQQAARNFERRRMELMYRGVKPAEIEEHIAELRNASANASVRDLKLMFVMARVAEDLKVRVDEAEVNNRIVQMAYERGARPDKLRQELIQSNQVGTVFQQVRDHKAMDMLIAKAKVSEMPAEEFNKKFGEAEKAEKASKKK